MTKTFRQKISYGVTGIALACIASMLYSGCSGSGNGVSSTTTTTGGTTTTTGGSPGGGGDPTIVNYRLTGTIGTTGSTTLIGAAHAILTGGFLWVSDTRRHQVIVYNLDGTIKTIIGSGKTNATNGFDQPEGIAADASGNVYVSDSNDGDSSNNARVQKFSPDGSTFLQLYSTNGGTIGTLPGQLNDPENCAVGADGTVYVADQGNARVDAFTNAGAFIASISGTPAGVTQPLAPIDVALDGAENVYVVDYRNSRIFEYSKTGSFIKSIGTSGNGHGQLSHPLSETFDKSGNLWVYDAGNNRLEEFNAAGAYVEQVPIAHTDAAVDNEGYGFAIDASGKIYFVDKATGAVNVYSPPA